MLLDLLMFAAALWDRVFGTEPAPNDMRLLGAAVSKVAPLNEPSNLRRVVRLALRSS